MTGTDGDPEGAPRWVKATFIAGAVLVVLLVAMAAFGGGGHGPGRHGGGGDPTPSSTDGRSGHTAPPGGGYG